VPVLWLVYASGIGGYWLVWDQLGLFSAIASAEWFDWLPIFSDPATRNFLPGLLNDRFFSLLVFLHIGIPLFLLLALWVHIQRVSQSDVFPARSLALGTFFMLLVLWPSPSPPSRTARPTFPSCRRCCTSTGTTCSSTR
jgi:hypothetical protein